MGIPAVYGWVAAIGLLIGFSLWLYYRIRKSATTEAALERETRARLEAERIAKEHQHVADIRARPLACPWGTELRDVDKQSGDPPGPASD